MIMVFKDLDTGKVSQYVSGDKIKGTFTLEDAVKEVETHKRQIK